MIINSKHEDMLISPARSIAGKVGLYNGSTLLQTFNHTDALKEFTVNRAGGKKFFGFGVCHELEVKLVDKERLINIEKEQILRVSFVVSGSTVSPTPKFYVSEVNRDENTNELTVKAYDAIHKADKYTVADLGLVAPYTVLDVANKIGEVLGLPARITATDQTAFNVEYPDGANFEGTEKLREVLDAIAEVTQTVYYANNNFLVFRRLGGEVDWTIAKSDYFTLKTKTRHTLATIVSATELGDNVSASAASFTGETQYVRNNPFWELRDDVDVLLENAIKSIGGFYLYSFECKWRGNYLLQVGDKIYLTTKDNKPVAAYLLNDKYTYNGGLVATTSWEYAANEDETANNPTTLGEALKKTYAKVDKANKEIEIVAGETSAIKLTTDSIQQSVSQMDNEVSELTREVNTKTSAEDVSISIQTAMNEGIERVTTTTGFTFNEEGLHISKSDSEITTSITEDGMTVYRNNDEVLTADNLGVRAEDLHATTFLIVGNNSRFEDYNTSRTGCFWIGT